MKFSCDKAILQNAISVTARAVAVKSSIAALSGLLLRCSNGTLTVIGANTVIQLCDDGRVMLNATSSSGIDGAIYMSQVD